MASAALGEAVLLARRSKPYSPIIAATGTAGVASCSPGITSDSPPICAIQTPSRMSDALVRIKRAVLAGRYAFSKKAAEELEADGLTELDVVEAIAGAVAIYKTLRSRNTRRTTRGERLYVVQGTNLEGVLVYTKGKFTKLGGVEMYYFLISAKRSVLD